MVGSAHFKKGTWTAEEDALLLEFVTKHGPSNWNTAHLLFPDLRRTGKSCRLRFLNQLHPGIRRASITPAEESTIFIAYSMLGNQWSRIAALLRGRTDNTVKNVVNMRLKRARRHAASVNFARRTAQMLSDQQVYGMGGSLDTYNHTSLPTSACGVSVVPPTQVAIAGMHDTWRCSTSSPGRYTALVTGRGAPAMNGLEAGMGACMNEHSPVAGMMSSTMETFNHMVVTESKRVAPSERTSVDAAPASSYHEWATPALLSVQEPRERLSGAGRLPSVQRPFESFQLPSVQNPFESSFQLPSVQNPFESLQLPSVQEPLQSLEGSELPSVQESSQSLLLGSELPSVQAQCQQADMAYRSSNRNMGDNDLLEAIKLTGYCSSSSHSRVGSPSPASSLHFDDSYLNTLLMGIEAGNQSSMASSTTSSPASSSAGLFYDTHYRTISEFNVSSTKQPRKEEIADSLMHDASSVLRQLPITKEEDLDAVLECLMMDGIETRDLAMMVLCNNNMWSSMPGACHPDESVNSDLIPDFN